MGRRHRAAATLVAGAVLTFLLGTSWQLARTGEDTAAATVAFVDHGERARLGVPVQEDGDQETTTTTAPTTTIAPTTTETTEQTTEGTTTTTEAPTTTETTEAIASSDGDVDWPLIAIIAAIVVVVLAIIWLLVAAGRSRARDERAQTRHIRDIVSRAEWMHDDVSLEVMAATTSPDRLRITWGDARRRINDLSSEATSVAASDSNAQRADDLRRLSHALGRLSGALDTHVSLQLQDPNDPSRQAAVAASVDTVTQRRNELLTALAPFKVRVS